MSADGADEQNRARGVLGVFTKEEPAGRDQETQHLLKLSLGFTPPTGDAETSTLPSRAPRAARRARAAPAGSATPSEGAAQPYGPPRLGLPGEQSSPRTRLGQAKTTLQPRQLLFSQPEDEEGDRPRRQDSGRTALRGAVPRASPAGEAAAKPGAQSGERQTHGFPHPRHASASAQQLGVVGPVCSLRGEAARAKRSALARTRWRNSVRFHFPSAYSLAKRGLVDRKQWKFLRFLQGKG